MWTDSWYPEEFLPALTRHFGPHSLASKNSLYPTLPNPLQTWSQPAGRSQLVNPSKLIQLTLLKAEQGALTPNCSTSSSEGVVTSSKETAIFLGRGDDYDSNYYCRLHNEHLSTIYLCHYIPSSLIHSWKSSYHAQIFVFLSNKAAKPGLRLKYHHHHLWWALLYKGTSLVCRIMPKQTLLNKEVFLAVFH